MFLYFHIKTRLVFNQDNKILNTPILIDKTKFYQVEAFLFIKMNIVKKNCNEKK